MASTYDDVVAGLRQDYSGGVVLVASSEQIDINQAGIDGRNLVTDVYHEVGAEKGIVISPSEVDSGYKTINHWHIETVPLLGDVKIPEPNEYLGFAAWRPGPTPPTIVGHHWLDGASDGRTVTLVNAQTHGTRWKIEQAPEGSVYLRSWNQNFRDDARWLDGGSDGRTVTLVNAQTHGTLWKIEQASEDTVYLRSWNQNYRPPNAPRWLDGGSDGRTVTLVNAQTHGTLWKIEQASEDTVYLRSWNQNYRP